MMRKKKFPELEIEAPGKITLSHHEGAIVCALEQDVSGNPEKLKNLVQSTISNLARWTAEQGGLVGHIKAALHTPSGTLIYFCTGDEVHIQEVPDQGTHLEFTAIVFFVDEKQLIKCLEPLLEIYR